MWSSSAECSVVTLRTLSTSVADDSCFCRAIPARRSACVRGWFGETLIMSACACVCAPATGTRPANRAASTLLGSHMLTTGQEKQPHLADLRVHHNRLDTTHPLAPLRERGRARCETRASLATRSGGRVPSRKRGRPRHIEREHACSGDSVSVCSRLTAAAATAETGGDGLSKAELCDPQPAKTRSPSRLAPGGETRSFAKAPRSCSLNCSRESILLST